MKKMRMVPLAMILIVIFGFFEAAHAGGTGTDVLPASGTTPLDKCQNIQNSVNLDATNLTVVERLYGSFTVFKHPIPAFENTESHFSVHIKLERGLRDETETGLNQYWFSFPTNVPTDWASNKTLCNVRRNTIKNLYKLFPCRYGFLEPFNLPDPGPDKMLMPLIQNLHIIQRDCQRPDGTHMIRGYGVIKVVIIDKPAPVVPAVKKKK